MFRYSAKIVLAFAALCLAGLPTFAAPVSFTFSGTGVFDSALHTSSGSFVIDDSLFNGGVSQFLQNSNITQLSFTTTSSAGTTSFGFADIVTSDGAFYDSSGSPTSIVNGSGFLASTSGLFLSINGTNEMLLSNGGELLFEAYTGSWTEAAVATTPLPAALPLFVGGLGVIGFLAGRRKRKANGLSPA